jgi:hypothetical protein
MFGVAIAICHIIHALFFLRRVEVALAGALGHEVDRRHLLRGLIFHGNEGQLAAQERV